MEGMNCSHCGKPATYRSKVSEKLLCDDCKPCWCFWCAGAIGIHGEEAGRMYMQDVEAARMIKRAACEEKADTELKVKGHEQGKASDQG